MGTSKRSDEPLAPPARVASHGRFDEIPVAPPSRKASVRYEPPARTMSRRLDSVVAAAPNRTASQRLEPSTAAPSRTTSKRFDETHKFFRQRHLVERIALIGSILLLCCFNCFDYIVRPASRLMTVKVDTPIPPVNATLASSKIVDIISIGSLTKPAFQNAQQRTFGSHVAVRNFHRITEMDDADRECSTHLTMDQFNDVVGFCKKGQRGESLIHYQTRFSLFKPKEHVGWLCAQKRPVDGLNKVLQQYREGLPIPEYVIIVDDDTYINMDSLVPLLQNSFPSSVPHVQTGCVFDFLRKSGFRFPYGGFGSFLSNKAIERLLQPIDCSVSEPDPFAKLACWRLKSSLLGESHYFHDGMSVSELMHQFSSQQPFTVLANWTSGYCLHSDHTLAYFLNYYHIAATDEKLGAMNELNDNILREFSYRAITHEEKGGNMRGECANERALCTVNNHVCHYIEPTQMDALHLEASIGRAVDTSKDMNQGLKVLEALAR